MASWVKLAVFVSSCACTVLAMMSIAENPSTASLLASLLASVLAVAHAMKEAGGPWALAGNSLEYAGCAGMGMAAARIPPAVATAAAAAAAAATASHGHRTKTQQEQWMAVYDNPAFECERCTSEP